jgi:hypothetical protein
MIIMKGFFKEAGRNWVILIKIHILLIFLMIVFSKLSTQYYDQIISVVALVLYASLFIQLVLFWLKPDWFKGKKR